MINSESTITQTPNLKAYKTLEVLYQGNRTLVYRALRTVDQTPVVIKTSQQNLTFIFSEVSAFRNQFTIGHPLNHPGLVRMLSLEAVDSRYALVMEDVQGMSLAEFLQSSVSLRDGLQIAIQLADILHYLYQHRVIHKDIKPSNILINSQTLQVKLIDFGIASLLPKEIQEIKNPHALEGSLAYIAPEQTGRMNRGIDFRSDFYGLGVTLFELFAGQLPFQADEPMAWLHCHIAQIPPSLTKFGVPAVVAEIVTKLLAKNAEDRYQSAVGLKHDLKCCLTQLTEQGEVIPFELGVRDSCDRILIPEKLYGRDAEVDALLATFDRVTQGSSELVLVTGFSGIGKTAVVNEIHKPITLHKGYFIQGKFDQYNRNIPFSAFVQAFRELVRQLLGESDQTLTLWKQRILNEVGANGQILLDVIPELEHIIGEQPLAPKLSGTAIQNRFNLVFGQFVQVFTAPEHPLVIFLDDLQWVDSASLNLLKILLTKAKTTARGYLLILGAYRDNEVLPGHPLLLALHEMSQQDAIVHTLTLPPLIPADINQLVADTLSCSADMTEPLAQLVYQKTLGNPFFTTQFLTGLRRDGLISFDREQGHWQCDLTQIQPLSLTNNVVDYLVKRLQMLPTATQEVLKVAACMGHQFDLDTLAVVCATPPEQVATNLWQSLQAGLVIPEGNTYKFFQGNSGEQTPENTANRVFQNTSKASSEPTDLATLNIRYRFLHDRVQQAAYQLIPEGQTQQVHLDIGRRWLCDASPEQQAKRLFDIISQLNQGRRLITDDAEWQTLIQLNLKAAKRAISATTAYDMANTCLQVCRELLSTDSWQTHYDLTLDIYNTSVEAAYLQGHWDEMTALCLMVERKATDILDTVKGCEFKIEANIVQGQFSEAIGLGLEQLASMGIEFPDQPDENDFKVYLQETQRLLAGRSATEIVNLPQMKAAHPQAILRLLLKIGTAAYNLTPTLYPLLGLKMVQLSLEHGNMPEAAMGYVRYGIVNCSVLGDIETGYSFGQAALQIINQFELSSYTAHTITLVHTLITHWQVPIEATLAPVQRAYTIGLESGELAYAGYAAYVYCSHAYFAGQTLSSLAVEIEHYNQAIAAINQKIALRYNHILHQSVLNLMGTSISPTQWTGKGFVESIEIPELHRDQDKVGLWCFYTNKLMLCYLFQEYEEALQCQQQAQKFARSGIGTIYTALLFFGGALTCLALLMDRPYTLTLEVSELEQWITVSKKKLHLWATHNPKYYQHKYDLVCAESHRLAGDRLAALEAYDQAITGAQANGYLPDEALANELAAKFYLDWGKEKIAAVYLQDAYACYTAWGAKAKTKDLERRYPHLLQPLLQKTGSVINPIETLASIVSPQVLSYSSLPLQGTTDVINNSFDFAAVLKAAQILTQTIERDELLQNLSQIILRNSGGDRLIVVLPNSAQDWEIQATATPTNIELCAEPLAGNSRVPVKLIQYVKNTRELLFSNHLSSEIPIVDSYLSEQCPQSFLCTPLTVQDELLGVLYLQSSTTRGLISPDRLVTLNFLFSQVAIGLNNLKTFEEALALKSKVIEASVDGMAILEEGQFIYLNQALLALYGYQEDELYGEGWEKLYAPTEVQRLYETTFATITEMGQWTGEATALRKNGTTFTEEVSLVRLDDGKLIYICRDISERKHLEAKRQKLIQVLQATSEENEQLYAESQEQTRRLQESQKKLEQIILQTPAAVIEWNPNFEFQTWNPAAQKIFGFSAEEALGQHFCLIVPPDQQGYVDGISNAILNQTGGAHAINENITKEGKYITCEWFNAPKFDADGNVYGGISIALNISDRQQLEQQQNRLIQILQSTSDFIGICQPETGILWQNQPFRELRPDLKIFEEQVPISKLYPQWAMEIVKQEGLPAAIEHGIWSGETALLTPSGEEIPTSQVIIAHKSNTGEVEYLSTILRDISDRKQYEQQLRELSERLELALESAHIGVWEWDAQNDHLVWDERMFALYGIQPEDFRGTYQDWEQCVHPDDLAHAQAADIPERQPVKEYRIIRPDGTIRHILATVMLQRDPQGQLSRATGVNLDISDRKTTELALKDSQARFRRMTEHVPGMIYRYVLHSDGSDELTYVNSQVRKLFELEPETALRNVAHVWERVHPEDIPRLQDALQLSAETLQPLRSEHCLILPKKGLRWVQLFAQPEHLDNGDVAWDGILVDISDRKQADQQLQALSERLELAVESAQLGIWEWDHQENILSWDDRMFTIYGASPNEFEGTYQDWANCVHPEDLVQLESDTPEIINGKANSYTQEFRVIRPDASVRYILATASIERNSQGQPIRSVGINLDITDRKEADLALRNAQAQFRNMTENVPGMIYRYVMHADGSEEMTYVSAQAREIFEVEPETVLQSTDSLWDKVHPDDISLVRDAFNLSAETLEPYHTEHRLILPQKGLRWVQGMARPERLNNSDTVWDGVVIDISDRKQAELALQEAQAQFRRMTENIPGMIFRCVMDPDGIDTITYISSQVREIYELEPEAVLEDGGRQMWTRTHPDDLAKVAADIQTSAETLRPFKNEQRLILPKKGLRWIQSIAQPERLTNGYLAWDGVVIDITDRKMAELSLQQSEEKFRTLVSNLHGAVYRSQYDQDWTINYISDAIADLSGYPANDFMENNVRTYVSIIHPEDTDYIDEAVAQAIAKRESYVLEYRILHRDGSVRWVYEKGKGIFDQNTLFKNFEGVIFDITDRKQAEAQLQRTNAELIRATHHKSAFLASMSHELRTPLNAVLGFSQLMQRDCSISDDHHEMLATINRNGEYLLALINDILEMSKIEAGKITLNPKPVDLLRFIDDIRETFRVKVEAKHLVFQVTHTPDLPRYIKADEVKLRQILLNLLSNALKFTQEGQISLHTQVLDRGHDFSPEKVHLQFTVSDTGPGVASEDLDSIFQAFIQSASGKQHHQGTGLGLPISHKFAQMMGGNLQVSSTLGKGSRFNCDIYAQILSADTEVGEMQLHRYHNIQGVKHQHQTYRLLIVDDNSDNRALLSQMLSIPGFEVRDVVNGSQAVEMNESWQPHLICMDMNMPQMDGMEATRRIRQSSCSPKIIAITANAITANAFMDDHQAALTAGCDDFLAKPFTEDNVFERIACLLKVEFETSSLLITHSQSQTDQAASKEDLIKAGFGAMPTAWQKHVQQAVRNLDDVSIRQLLAEVPAEHEGMVEAISKLLKDYRYDILMSMLDIEP